MYYLGIPACLVKLHGKEKEMISVKLRLAVSSGTEMGDAMGSKSTGNFLGM